MSNFKIIEYAGNNLDENVDFCINKVQQLLSEGFKNDEILFLYRRTKMYHPYYIAFRKHGIRIQSKTIHSAKGLEAKVVFILGLTDGYGGFPDIWMEDRIFQVVKLANHDSLMEEERLFYVAITQAKDQLYLMTEKGNTSRFLKEIPEVYKEFVQAQEMGSKAAFQLCTKCQKQVVEGFLFCPFCGKKQLTPKI